MILSGEEYSKRLATFSDDTVRLMSKVFTTTKEATLEAMKIASNSELTEEQVVEKLQELLRSNETRKTPTSR